ncbi:MAG TPA: CPBP family glutamic-type intramembrane protease [Actinomycetes bacterium]|nr:CPBP family glutamic-type intramembrane protease [Actinomycetes bacterium]
MTTGPTLSTPPGWYPDPHDPASQRWWDGATWTSHVAIPAATIPARPAAQSVVAPPQGRWGLGDVGWTVVAVIVTFIIGVVIFAALAITSPDLVVGGALKYDAPAVAWLLVVTQLLVMGALVGWPIIAAHWKGEGWRKSFGFVVNTRAFVIGGIGGIVTFVVMAALTALSSVVLGREVDSAAADVVSGMQNVTLAYATFLVIIAIGAPFVEEIAFRGLLWGGMVKHGWSPWVATSVSAVAFGAFHFEPLRIVALIAAGVTLGIVRHYAGLGASMFSHAIVNTIGVVTLLATT